MNEPTTEPQSQVLWRVLAWMERVRACDTFLLAIKHAAREAAKREKQQNGKPRGG